MRRMGFLSLRTTLIVVALLFGLAFGEALDRLSPVEVEDAIQQCGFVQELNYHRKRTAPPPAGWTQQAFAKLFPYGPAVNALLATLYISGPPNFLLALCPPNVDPASLSTMVAFAVGGLLGDTIFHLLPEIYLGETSPDQARFVLVDSNKNLLLGVAMIIGFLTFLAMDKALRIGTGGDSHEHEAKKASGEKTKDKPASAITSGADKGSSANGSLRARKGDAETAKDLEILGDVHALKASSGHIESIRNLKEPVRANRWLSEVLEQDDSCGVTQIAIWKAYEAAFRGSKEAPLLEATLLIHNASKVFENASAQIIEGEERKFIIRGVRPSGTPPKEKISTAIAKAVKPDKSGARDSAAPVRLSAYLNLIADFTHNITDGLAISSSFYASPTLGATTTVAVFFHEIPHEVGDFALLIQSGFSKGQAMGAQFVTALGALLGTCIGIAIQELGKTSSADSSSGKGPADSTGFFGTGLGWGDMLLPFTAGTFFYVGTVAVIPDMLETGANKGQEVRKTFVQFAAMLIGAGIMLGISWT